MKTSSVSGKETNMDTRSQVLASAQSVHHDGAQQNETPDRPDYDFTGFVVRPEQVADIWEAEEPNQVAQKLILDHFEFMRETQGVDVMQWDENENRYEPNELKWIASYLVEAVVFTRN